VQTSGNPPHSAPLSVVTPLAAELAAAGARAVWLAGSHARLEASPHSDIDIGVIADRAGAGPGYRLERRGEHLVSVAWTTAEATCASFRYPAVLGGAVPGWRGAVLLHDPDGVATALRDEARAWRWDDVAGACDAWVAEQITGWAEEVHKLVAAIESGGALASAVQRNVLALRLAPVLAMHRRILYDTENALWDLVARREGEPWTSLQRAALAVDGESLATSTRAALAFYDRAAAVTDALLDARQRSVVAHARGLIAATLAAGERR
jgi:hypothetical protein